ncbi:hypothetical protein FU658_14120 [Alkalisalibacterium limincola]|uniref:Uncharacterized protein n=1 Tax=Alkalisalibacterium limincola TaxID=2699169 RepID=A0A5C8KHR0_9GAMM|nr:hypothetical protein FU658_14120 [Alkalisalibacterium limincola]
MTSPTSTDLRLSLMRALLGEVHPQLRTASIEADSPGQVVRVRFVYDGDPLPEVRQSCESAGTECLADFPAPWTIDEQHISCPVPERIQNLTYLVYQRCEGWPDA